MFSSYRYFVVEFDGPPTIVQPLSDYFRRDIDIVRPTILRRDTENTTDIECPGPFDERYNPVVKNMKKLKDNVRKELEEANIKV